MTARKTPKTDLGDPLETPEEDLWFLPGPPEDLAPTDFPWPVANQTPIFETEEWVRSEKEMTRALVDAAVGFARLDERLRNLGTGAIERIALAEVSELSWAQGDWIPSEKIALYLHLRESTVKNAKELSSAAWAIRRMLGRMRPEEGLGEFLGRQHVSRDSLAGLSRRAVGDDFDGLEHEWSTALLEMRVLHPITQACASFYIWRSLGLSEPGAVLEAAVVAGKVGTIGSKSMQFLPVALGDRAVFGQGGDVSGRLEAWCKSVQNACLRTHLLLDQLLSWRDRALTVTQGMSGKTPPALIEALMNAPVLSTELAAQLAGCSRATAQRNLAIFCDSGLILETTGQGRYRFWRAAT